MKWTLPPIIKVYEALGSLADDRVKIDGDTAKVYSSSRGKFYTVTYDSSARAIMSNDNGSYWRGYLGYPAIAVLMTRGVLPFNERLATALAGIPWKDINTKFRNDFAQTEAHVNDQVVRRGVSAAELKTYAASVLAALKRLALNHLGPKQKPPAGY